jgi:hypothetical protein
VPLLKRLPIHTASMPHTKRDHQQLGNLHAGKTQAKAEKTEI